jgi:NAD(P)-dependent dehydrogenase (short-subunit alcohol dehydrogenase family)
MTFREMATARSALLLLTKSLAHRVLAKQGIDVTNLVSECAVHIKRLLSLGPTTTAAIAIHEEAHGSAEYSGIGVCESVDIVGTLRSKHA